MQFGLQKLTLLDYPGQVACTVFSRGCNYRCPFCHNGSLVNGSGAGEMLSADEVLEFLKKRKGILDGVCFTGGEPLLGDEVLTFAGNVKSLGFKVKIDTNGSFPERLQQAVAEKIADYVAMDIKNSPAKYALTAGCDYALPQVEKSVAFLLQGNVPYEFRTTVTGKFHETADFSAIGQWIKGAEKYFLQPYNDSGDVLVPDPDYPVDGGKLAEFLAAVRPFVASAEIRGR